MRLTAVACSAAVCITFQVCGQLVPEPPLPAAAPAPAPARGMTYPVNRSRPPQADKSAYTLFNPTPPTWLRNLSSDRPDKTEAPYTVDAGHLQIETDLVSHTHDRNKTRSDNSRISAWEFAPVQLRLGVCNRVELRTSLTPYRHVTTEDRLKGTRIRQSGLGDLTTGLKVNLWGNDGGATALGLLPFVKYPTSQDHLGNNSVEGGLAIPFALELRGGFAVGLMTGVNCRRDQAGRGHHAECINSVSVSRDLLGDLGAYVEFWTNASTERDSNWAGTFDVGITYALTDDIQLDAGVNLGLTRAADDLQPFLGLTMRF